MSREAPRPVIKLTLKARPGIAIRLLDSGLQEVARGIGQLETRQPEGLYQIEWSSAGRQSQMMIRLDGSEDVEISFDATDPAIYARSALVDAVSDGLRPSESSYGSSIVLIVAGEGDVAPEFEELELRLLNREDVAMRASGSERPHLSLGAGEFARCYRVKPGRYHVGFRSINGERLGQSVPALAGRQTLLFLTAARAKLLVADGRTFGEEINVGIDPARTVAATVRGDEEDDRIRERVRLAGLLLYDLANGAGSLSPDVVRVLDDEQTDPLLKLYGALVALSCLERGLSPAPDEAWTNIKRPPAAAQRRWAERICRWADEPGRPGIPPDALTAWWALRRVAPALIDASTFAALPSRIEVPPMLECAWRWAIEESIARPDAVRGTAIVAAAARSAMDAAPWLCWKISAAKARSAPTSGTAEDLSPLIRQIAAQVASFAATSVLTHSLVAGLEKLSPEAQATALRVGQLAMRGRRTSSADLVRDVALALGLPSRQLHKRLVKASEEIEAATAPPLVHAPPPKMQSKRAGKAALTKAPGLSRRIRINADPQKGRFGGRSKRGGFTLSARFDETRSKNWVKIIVRVEGRAEDGEEVQFHLHDSFRPPLKKRRFKQGVAELTATAWGGFTIGVWIPVHSVELELDLARCTGAPRIIRTR